MTTISIAPREPLPKAATPAAMTAMTAAAVATVELPTTLSVEENKFSIF